MVLSAQTLSAFHDELEKLGVLAHISGASGSGKTTILNSLSKAHPGLVVKDLDEIDEEAEQQLGFSDIRKRNYTDKMLSSLAGRRQELLDTFLKKNSRRPVVLGGHHTEGPHVLKFPTKNRVMLDTGPVRSAWRGYLRDDTRKLREFPSDYREARETIDDLVGSGYTPVSASDIKNLVSKQMGKTAGSWPEDYAKHTALNLGQAARDVRYVHDYPGEDTVLGSMGKRLPSLAHNLLFAALPPRLHHTKEELAESDPYTMREMFQHGYAPWDHPLERK